MIMASSPITSWPIDGETMETVRAFIFLGSKITAAGDCSHEIKRHLFLGRKSMTNLDSILKSRDITLPTKVHLVKAMVFPVVMYGYESWTIKKAECWRIDAFEVWCWRILLRVPWIARGSNQSILKEISPEYLLVALMLKLKLQYFGHLMWRTDSLEKILILGKIEGRRRRGEQRMRWLDGSPTGWTWVWVSSRIWWWTGRPGLLQSLGWERVGHDWVTELSVNYIYHVALYISCTYLSYNWKLVKLSQDPEGSSWAQKPFCITNYLIVGNRLLLAFFTFPAFRSANSNSCSSGNGETREEHTQEKIVLAWGTVLVSPQEICCT